MARVGRPMFLIVGIALALIASGPVAAAAPAWRVQSSPSPSSYNDGFYGVACPTETTCLAVGATATQTTPGRPLAEGWDGHQWRVVTVPMPRGTQSGILYSIACPSAKSCFAVGSTGAALIEHWDGHAFTASRGAKTPGTGGATLFGVSCTNVNNCYAVGDFSYDVIHAPGQHTLVEHWNGQHWELVLSPTPAGAKRIYTYGVSCPTTTTCFAVGTADLKPFFERMQGLHWSLTAGPPAGSGGIDAVSCVSATSCVAVGDSAEHWNGNHWGLIASPASANLGVVTGLDCLTATNCIAVGVSANNQAVVGRWDGSSWSVVPSPGPSDWHNSRLSAIDCTSATRCAAAGYRVANSALRTLVERYS